VLIEDYTGKECGNCPRAHELAAQLKGKYGDKLVVLSIHAGPFALPNIKHTYDFRTPEGTEWDNFFGISKKGNPNGMIDRINYDKALHIMPTASWEENLIAELKRTPEADLELSLSYNSSSKTISAMVSYSITTTKIASPNLVVCLVEDSIIYYQKDYDKTPSEIENYCHMNVMRGTFTPGNAWGETLSIKQGLKKYTLTLDSLKGYNPAHLKAVAFIHDQGASYRVIQAAEAPLF